LHLHPEYDGGCLESLSRSHRPRAESERSAASIFKGRSVGVAAAPGLRTAAAAAAGEPASHQLAIATFDICPQNVKCDYVY